MGVKRVPLPPVTADVLRELVAREEDIRRALRATRATTRRLLASILAEAGIEAPPEAAALDLSSDSILVEVEAKGTDNTDGNDPH